MTEHPAPYRLEALQVGEVDVDAQSHLDNCVECQAYVQSLQSEQEAFLAQHDPFDYVRQLRSTTEESTVVETANARPWWSWAMPLAVSALAVLAVVRPWGGAPETTPIVPEDPQPEVIRFKGSVQVAVVVSRQGKQTRHTKRFSPVADDRIAIELTLPKAMTVTVGLIVAEGDYTEWMPAKKLAAGVTVLEQTITVKDQAETAKLIAGEPAAVRTATQTGDYSKVAVFDLVGE